MTPITNQDSQLKQNLAKYIYSLYKPIVTQTEEYPSHRMEYQLRHDGYISDRDLEREFPDMEIKSEGPLITITCIPPYNAFDENEVLRVVQKYDRSARVVSTRRA